MLIALLSDVHANVAALSAVLAHIARIQPAHTFALGDLVGRGPEPQRTADLMASTGIRMLRGNWDEWIAGAPGWDVRPKRRAWVEAARAMMKKKALEHLLDPPQRRRLIFDGVTIVLAHGSPRNPIEGLTPSVPDDVVEEAISGTGADVVAVGHSHQAFIRRIKHTLVINVGSVGYPFNGDPRACFALLHVEHPPRAELIRVPYRMERNLRSMRRVMKRGIVSKEAALRYQTALLGDGPEPLEALRAGDTGSEASVRLLARRIRDVYGGASGEHLATDDERIRDLRVATRRLREAFTLARPMLASRPLLVVVQRLVLLSRILGQRRNADALYTDLSTLSIASEEQARIIDVLRAFIDVRRKRTGERIARRCTRERFVAEGLDAMSLSLRLKDDARSVASLGGDLLRIRLKRLESALPSIDDPTDSEAHHRLRIQLRRLRYAIGILSEPFPDLGLAPIEEISKENHVRLGRLHDTCELARLLESRRAYRTARGTSMAPLLEQVGGRKEAFYTEAKQSLAARGGFLCAELTRIIGRL